MHSAFDLAPDGSPGAFAEAWSALAAVLLTGGLLVAASGLAERRTDTPLDTDGARPQRYFTIMSFRDHAQSEAAYARIEARAEPTAALHAAVVAMVRDAVFTCWEDLGPDPAATADPAQGA